MAVRVEDGREKFRLYQPPPGCNSMTVMSRLEAEELQGLDGVPVLIARLVRSRTPVAVHGFLQQRNGVVGWFGGVGAGDGDEE